MGFLEKIKSVLPVSSRSFHAYERELSQKLDSLEVMMRVLGDRLAAFEEGEREISKRVEQSYWDITGNIDYKFEKLTLPTLQKIEGTLDAHDAFVSAHLWDQYRNEDETEEEARLRFFKSIPPAKGALRAHQTASAQLLREFDALCRDNGLRYWIEFGTLLGAVRHGGFVPWDDDLDVGMVRPDLERLRKVAQRDDRYRITEVFDAAVHCRQIRFRYADEGKPFFIDLFVYDFVPSNSKTLLKAYGEIRLAMVEAMRGDSRLDAWHAATFAQVEESPDINAAFEEGNHALRSLGFGCNEEEARGLAWGIENMDGGAAYPWSLFPINDVFPLRRLHFEGVECFVPNNPEGMLTRVYGDYLLFPKDIRTHYKHVSLEDE
ncbi:LicD family protein [Enterorhabdus sp. P55]|uniref:LicD family protein n=1 Tax=Enterorhabdus sp. P55 TaxID=2304571 RepID=UPI00136F7CAD|nr:phosphorylcholine metabolism protein [Enterorhabdus sp. P55]